MILAAGLGTRFKPFTDKHPKALAIVNGKTILQRNIEYLQKVGIKEVVVNVHHFASQIIDVLSEHKGFGSTIHISDETNEVLETGGGLLFAKEFLNSTPEPFVLMNVDILTDLNLTEMLHYHQQHKALATLAVRKRETSRFLLFNEDNILVGWRNANTNEEKIVHESDTYYQKAFSGVHIIEPKIFSLITQDGKFSMIDLYLEVARKQTVLGWLHDKDVWIDVGKPQAIEIAAQYLNQLI